MSSEELKEQIKEMLVTNLMLRTPKEEISNDLPLLALMGSGWIPSTLCNWSSAWRKLLALECQIRRLHALPWQR